MMGSRSSARKAVPVTCDWYKVNCEPVSADLIQRVLASGVWGWDLLNLFGNLIPSWVLRNNGDSDHREDRYCRVGSFPKPGRLMGRLPKPGDMRGKWVFPWARLKCAECGCFPGRETGCAVCGCFPGRDDCCAQDRCSPDKMNYCKCIIGWLLYKTGIRANSQERHSPGLMVPNKPCCVVWLIQTPSSLPIQYKSGLSS